MTMLEKSGFDPRPVASPMRPSATTSSGQRGCADLDVIFVGTRDTARPLGIKGLGKISVVGVSAAIADAVSPAAGRRIRSLPITAEQLL
jgi:hypothetical protein